MSEKVLERLTVRGTLEAFELLLRGKLNGGAPARIASGNYPGTIVAQTIKIGFRATLVYVVNVKVNPPNPGSIRRWSGQAGLVVAEDTTGLPAWTSVILNGEITGDPDGFVASGLANESGEAYFFVAVG